MRLDARAVTMDPEYSRCVQKVFVELYKKGLIYRGKRMVNWCPPRSPRCRRGSHHEEQKGSLYYFKVEIAEAPGTFLTIATTRPETIPGDTAVAVIPKTRAMRNTSASMSCVRYPPNFRASKS